MNPPLVYCDTAGYNSALGKLKNDKKIVLIHYPYENINSKIKKKAIPSKMTWNDVIRPWSEEFYPWKDYEGSSKYELILQIVGLENRKDALHIDSAYKSRCSFFVTTDKSHIISKSQELEKMLGIEFVLRDDVDLEKKILETRNDPYADPSAYN